jgi:hypothetical protein
MFEGSTRQDHRERINCFGNYVIDTDRIPDSLEHHLVSSDSTICMFFASSEKYQSIGLADEGELGFMKSVEAQFEKISRKPKALASRPRMLRLVRLIPSILPAIMQASAPFSS